MATTPLPDHQGWKITPTLHSTVNKTTDPSLVTLPTPFAVCVTGASRGIGAHIIYAYARAGASTLILVGRDASALTATSREARRIAKRKDVQIITSICDVASDTDMARLAKEIKSQVGRLDVAVANAALWGSTDTRVTEGSTQQFQDVVNIDIMGGYLTAHYLLPLILESEGDGPKALFAIGGTGAWVVDGPVCHAAHCMSKLAQARLMEIIANDFKDARLLVCTVHPGCVYTDTSKLAPEMFLPFLTDDAGLCGGFLVWLTHQHTSKLWLNGRFLSATWDADELSSMQDAIVQSDMLKARMVVT
ncbi:MAG: hypothetical protein Q9174_007062 [Haloplaca sp. 1 TL-2023]